MFSYLDIFTNKKSVLFVTAHPDDTDIFFGGLIASLRQDKIDCYFLILTSGDKGGQDKIRESEQIASLNIVGIPKNNIIFARLPDGHLENNLDLIKLVVQAIRQFKPDLVCTIDPRTLINLQGNISHRDHRAAGLATLDAIYPYSETPGFFPEFSPKHKVYEVVLANSLEINFRFNLAKFKLIKEKLLSCHKSQWDKEDIQNILETRPENFFYFKLQPLRLS